MLLYTTAPQIQIFVAVVVLRQELELVGRALVLHHGPWHALQLFLQPPRVVPMRARVGAAAPEVVFVRGQHVGAERFDVLEHGADRRQAEHGGRRQVETVT